MNYQKCLVGVDFSEASKRALKAALEFSRTYDFDVSVVHIVDEQAAAAFQKYMVLNDVELLKHMELRVRELLNDVCPVQDKPQVYVKVGHPYVSIIELCEEESFDLLVMGVRSLDENTSRVGPIAAKCIRKGPADVLLIRDNAEVPFRRILACVDLSPTSAKVVKAAQDLSQDEVSKLFYLMVYQTPLALTVDYAGFVPAIPIDQEDDCVQCKEDLKQFVRDCSTEIVNSDENFLIVSALQVKDGIISAIGDEHIDLVCLGTKGHNTMKTLLLGTTAERVISHACCSILAVKPSACASQSAEFIEYPPEMELPPSNLRVC